MPRPAGFVYAAAVAVLISRHRRQARTWSPWLSATYAHPTGTRLRPGSSSLGGQRRPSRRRAGTCGEPEREGERQPVRSADWVVARCAQELGWALILSGLKPRREGGLQAHTAPSHLTQVTHQSRRPTSVFTNLDFFQRDSQMVVCTCNHGGTRTGLSGDGPTGQA